MGKTNMDRVNQTVEDIKNGRGSGSKVPTVKMQEGLNRYRILPPPDGMDVPWLETEVSFGVGENEKTLINRKQFGLTPCPLSDYIDKLASKKAKASADELKQITPKKRFKMWVIDRDDEDVGPKLLDTNIMVMKDILKFFMDPEYGDLSDPEEGHDVKITYIPKEKAKGPFPKWEITVSPKQTPLKPKGMEQDEYDLMLASNLFEEHRIGFPNSVEYMEAVLAGTDEEFKGSRSTRPDGSPIKRDDATDEEDEDEEPAKPAAKPVVNEDADDDSDEDDAKPSTSDDETADDETADEDDGEEEDEEEAAVKAAVAKAAADKAAKDAAKQPSSSTADRIREKLKGKK